MKSSNLYKHFRELVVGENQYVRINEWTSELPNRTSNSNSRLWRMSHRYKRRILSIRFA